MAETCFGCVLDSSKLAVITHAWPRLNRLVLDNGMHEGKIAKIDPDALAETEADGWEVGEAEPAADVVEGCAERATIAIILNRALHARRAMIV